MWFLTNEFANGKQKNRGGFVFKRNEFILKKNAICLRISVIWENKGKRICWTVVAPASKPLFLLRRRSFYFLNGWSKLHVSGFLGWEIYTIIHYDWLVVDWHLYSWFHLNWSLVEANVTGNVRYIYIYIWLDREEENDILCSGLIAKMKEIRLRSG